MFDWSTNPTITIKRDHSHVSRRDTNVTDDSLKRFSRFTVYNAM